MKKVKEEKKEKIGFFKKKREKIDEKVDAKQIERYSPDINEGLNEQQVAERTSSMLLNTSKIKNSKSYLSIFVKNICTFFNLIWLIIAVALLVVGSYNNLTFVFVIVANTAIAIIQEIRAKITVEKLSIVTTPHVKTIRSGKVVDIPSEKLALDDIIILTNGNQIPADCVIVEGKVEVNESLLTGESNAIERGVDMPLLSGSFIVAGTCKARVDKIGKENYIYQMAERAKEFKAPSSNLFKDLNRLIKYIGIALVPIGVLTFLKELTIPSNTIESIITKTSGALTSMIPAGMFLLVTISLAAGVVKLSRKKTLVKDLYSIEMLARTNVLCLDKTGTITDGTMNVVDFVTYGKQRKATVMKMLSSVLNSQKSVNATSNALIKEFGRKGEMKALNVMEFSSERKYSVTQLSNKKCYFLGATTRIGCKLTQEQQEFIAAQQNKGYRVLCFAESSCAFDKKISGASSTAIAFIIIEETIRQDAIETIQWFKDNGVEIKIISGDDPATVSKIAQRVGVENSDKFVSLENTSLKEVEQMADQFTVFGRVTPEQKYTIVKALKNKGKVVAMTGDGVNDTLALKEADCSIAMADGSEVARSISKLVLLESNFSSLPAVVKEGRQVINNVQNSSSLFLMKTFFAIVLTVITLIMRKSYPFEPSHMLLLEAFVIGIPSFILTFIPNNNQIQGNFIPQVMKRALPRALLMLINVLVVMALYNSKLGDAMMFEEYRTLAVLVLTYTGFLNLVALCFSKNLIKIITIIVSFVAITVAIAAFPDFFAVTVCNPTLIITFFTIMLCSIILMLLLRANKRWIDKLREKIIALLQSK